MKKLLFLVPALFFFVSLNLFANKTSVTVKSSATLVQKGTEVTITINVTHKGNSKAHFTDWVTLKYNGKELKRWEYTKASLPSDQNFTLEYKMKVMENGTLEVQGHCNLHGSTGARGIILKIE